MKTYPSRLDMIRSFPAGSVGAEVGVFRGYFSIDILNHASVGKLFLVDPWKRFGEAEYPDEPVTGLMIIKLAPQ